MGGVHHEEAKKHFVFGYCGDKTENSSQQEKYSPKHTKLSYDRDFFSWVFFLWCGFSIASWLWRSIHNFTLMIYPSRFKG